MRTLHRAGLWLLTLTLAASWPAAALSIFDVIQLSDNGYGDQQIIDLIDATGSVFELEAQDLPRLKQLGVREAVIRAMLERVPEERPSGVPRSDPSPGPETRREHAHEETVAGSTGGHEHAGERTGAGVADIEEDPGLEQRAERDEPSTGSSFPDDSTAPVHPEARRTADLSSVGATEPLVSFRPFKEERGGNHLHLALTLSGLEVLILRDEGPFPSMQARALEVARRLGAALALGNGTCYREATARGPSVVFQSAATHQRLTLLEITAADARAYEIRSGRRVTPDLLAAYWADLLSDFMAIAMGRPPNRTLALHDGDALGVLYQALRSSVGRGGGLRGAAELLPSSVRHHLERLTAAVPVDYDRQAEWAY